MNCSSLLFSHCTMSLHGINCMLFPYNPQHIENQYLEYTGHSIKEHKLLIPNIFDKL